MNRSSVKEFILEGLTDRTGLYIPLFIIFLPVYITTILGNIGIISLINVDRHLQKPMYFFLSNLSFVDLTYSSSVTPKMLQDLLSESRTISFIGCVLQMFTFVSFATVECFLLGIMAYDRYVAICRPLLYGVIMSNLLCLRLVVSAYLGGLLNAMVEASLISHLNFCKSHVISHFFCDMPPLFKLSCSDITMNIVTVFIVGGLITGSCLIIILVSYMNIVLAILRIRSTQGRYKAFSTCTSHMTAVTIFYGTVVFMYFRPSSSYALQQDKVASVFYSILIPMLNPFIYSLRNTEVKEAAKRLVKK
ncbi:olfactory receptor 5F1-like [Leptodactylus fuscus]|uniref:olfactory receptor 5F1-like n=1 Tax=Leptodactylus fuscus TaxID=238119 RepID=UPI003F4E5815